MPDQLPEEGSCIRSETLHAQRGVQNILPELSPHTEIFNAEFHTTKATSSAWRSVASPGCQPPYVLQRHGKARLPLTTTKEPV